MKKIKSKLALIALVAIVLAFFGQATVAYISNVGQATNVVTSGGIEVEVIGDFSSGINIYPGDVVAKDLSVKNPGNHPFYVRVKLTYAVDDASLTADGCLAPYINTQYWEEHDGWYYYKGVVAPNETTPKLFDQVEIVGDKVDSKYINKNLTMSAFAQAVQSENNPITDGHTYTASGWPA